MALKIIFLCVQSRLFCTASNNALGISFLFCCLRCCYQEVLVIGYLRRTKMIDYFVWIVISCIKKWNRVWITFHNLLFIYDLSAFRNRDEIVTWLSDFIFVNFTKRLALNVSVFYFFLCHFEHKLMYEKLVANSRTHSISVYNKIF